MPTLNRENDYFIYQLGKDIYTNILVEDTSTKQVDLIPPTDEKYKSFRYILTAFRKKDTTIDLINKAVRDALNVAGITDEAKIAARLISPRQ